MTTTTKIKLDTTSLKKAIKINEARLKLWELQKQKYDNAFNRASYVASIVDVQDDINTLKRAETILNNLDRILNS